MHAPRVMRVSLSGKRKSLRCFETYGCHNTPPNTEISAAIGRLVGSDISRAFPRQQDHPMTLPSCKATITLRVTRVRIRVKDHPLSNSSPAGGHSGPGGPHSPSEQSGPTESTYHSWGVYSFIKRRATAGLHNEIMLYQQIGRPDLWSKVSFSLQMAFSRYCRSFMTRQPLQGACKTACSTGNGIGPTANHSSDWHASGSRQYSDFSLY